MFCQSCWSWCLLLSRGLNWGTYLFHTWGAELPDGLDELDPIAALVNWAATGGSALRCFDVPAFVLVDRPFEVPSSSYRSAASIPALENSGQG